MANSVFLPNPSVHDDSGFIFVSTEGQFIELVRRAISGQLSCMISWDCLHTSHSYSWTLKQGLKKSVVVAGWDSPCVGWEVPIESSDPLWIACHKLA